MFTVSLISDTLAFIPIAFVTFLFPVMIFSLLLIATEKRRDKRLRAPESYVFSIMWLIAALAVIGICQIGDSYLGPIALVLYMAVSIAMVIVTAIVLVVAIIGDRR